MKNNFIEFEGGETPFPEKIRKLNTIGDDAISPSTKFVYLALKWSKGVLSKKDNRFDPSYLFMKRRFGISADTYQNALTQLSDIKAISVNIDKHGDKKYLRIDMLHDKDDIAERIPSVIVTTELLTVSQKLFLSLVWKMLYVDSESCTVSTYHSSYKISKALECIGIAKRTTYKRIAELSEDSGYIKLIDMRDDGGFSIDMKAILAMWQHEENLWTRFKLLGGKKSDYPIYRAPKVGDFSFDGEKIIKNI